MDDLQQRLVGHQRPVVRLVVGPTFPTAKRAAGQRRQQLVVERVEERFDRPFEMGRSRGREVELDPELKRRLLQVLAGQVGAAIADEFFGNAETGPRP